MAKRHDNHSRRPSNKEKAKLKAIYEKSRADFTAADLQKFTQLDEGIPFEKVLSELEELHRKRKRKRA
jgi:hypothetical protein